jgi:4-amino-4-deoxy-L-arabinose transferase-like glycosyltransferase
LALGLDLTPDEAYYWEFARRPALSYFDHPPMVGYLIALARFVFGDTVLAVRLPALIGFSLLLRVLFTLGRRIGGNSFVGFLTAVLLQIHPAGTALGFIMTPDVPLAVAWGVGIVAFLNAIEHDRWRWWVLLGFSLAFGAMSKYNMIFFCPGVAVVILGWRDLRARLGSGRFWSMILLAALGALPVVLWNADHDWISLRFQFRHGFRPSDRSAVSSIGEFLGGQLGTLGPVLFPLIWYVTIQSLIQGWRQNDRPRFALAILALPTMVFFLKRGFQSKVEANWPQIAYLSVMPLVAHWLAGGNFRRRLAVVCFPSLILMALAVFQAFTLYLPLPGRSDVSMRLHGWEALGEVIRLADEKTGKQLLFVGQGVPFTGLVAFYGQLPPDRITTIHGMGNWRFWWKDSLLPIGADIVYVDEGKHSEAPNVARFFEQSVMTEQYPMTARGRFLRTIHLTYLHGYKGGLKFDGSAKP